MHLENRWGHNWLAKKINNDQIVEYCKAMRGTVIDLGCGTRPYESDILKFADRYIGVDWGNTLHGFSADIMADLSKCLPIENEATDIVVCFEVIEHVREPFVLLQEANRILRPGGKVFLSVPFQWQEHETPWDYYRFTRFGLTYLFEKAGFTSIDVTDKSGFWVMWVLKLNYHLFLLVKGSKIRRRFTRMLLIPIWWLGQIIAPKLDLIGGGSGESIGYFVAARKP